MKISVICPTTEGRAKYHERLYKQFKNQDINKYIELLVLDDAQESSPFFDTKDDIWNDVHSVTYHHISKKLSIGKKRNMLCSMARGEFIAHFDDDDLYAPNYLSTMLAQFTNNSILLCKLSSWKAHREIDDTYWYWDTSLVTNNPYRIYGNTSSVERVDTSQWNANEYRDSTLWGFGFSYMYRRSAWLTNWFEDLNHGEDFEFFKGIREKCIYENGTFTSIPDDSPDRDYLALHTLHNGSSSCILPQKQI